MQWMSTKNARCLQLVLDVRVLGRRTFGHRVPLLLLLFFDEVLALLLLLQRLLELVRLSLEDSRR